MSPSEFLRAHPTRVDKCDSMVGLLLNLYRANDIPHGPSELLRAFEAAKNHSELRRILQSSSELFKALQSSSELLKALHQRPASSAQATETHNGTQTCTRAPRDSHKRPVGCRPRSQDLPRSAQNRSRIRDPPESADSAQQKMSTSIAGCHTISHKRSSWGLAVPVAITRISSTLL